MLKTILPLLPIAFSVSLFGCPKKDAEVLDASVDAEVADALPVIVIEVGDAATSSVSDAAIADAAVAPDAL